MTQEDIFIKLGITNATDVMKQEVLRGLIEKVDLLFANIVDDLLSDDQKEELESIVDQASDPSEVVQWLQENVPKAAELYDAILRDEVDILKDKLG